ncbi:hypothetical protein FRC11_002642, partial [Ceratobasidium sp. 423]
HSNRPALATPTTLCTHRSHLQHRNGDGRIRTSSCRHRRYVLTRSSVISSYRWHEFLALDDDDFGAPAPIQNLGNGWDL